jgi:hypothetical protein
MTSEDAKKICVLITNCDGGCSSCVSNLTELANKLWPEFKWDRMIAEAGWEDGKNTEPLKYIGDLGPKPLKYGNRR